MNAPVSWTSRVETYLAYRRRHGFKLSVDATQLGSFARFADQIGTEDHLTVALARIFHIPETSCADVIL